MGLESSPLGSEIVRLAGRTPLAPTQFPRLQVTADLDGFWGLIGRQTSGCFESRLGAEIGQIAVDQVPAPEV